MTEIEIASNFPLAQPRDGQLETVKYILDSFNNGKKFVILEAPTGAGKSPIAMTVAKFFDSVYYLTVQKVLQDQLTDDFGETGRFGNLMVDLKGRNAYECTYKLNPAIHSKHEIDTWNASAPHTCADGHCRKKGESSHSSCLKSGTCPYFAQVEKAKVAPICLMNFASCLHQTTYTKRFSPRGLLILDEGHNIESQLMGFISVSVVDSDFNGLVMPEYESPQEYATWFNQCDILGILAKRRVAAIAAERPDEVDEITSQINKIGFFLEEMKEHADQWVVEYETTQRRSHRATFKPIFVDRYAHNMLFNLGAKILIMSATILNVSVVARSLGIESPQVASKRLGSKFPLKNRPIYYQPAAKVVGGDQNAATWGPKLIHAVDNIVEKYAGMRGIIHTHNFAIAEMLIEQCKSTNRFLFQKHFRNKAEMLRLHAELKDSVIVAPAMHEGLDLIDDLSRFQVICKIPFPNFHSDKQLAARKAIDPQFYDWLTALKLVQSAGRSVRTPQDWADTYILDESFGWWYKRNHKMLPGWFTEAIQGLECP